MAQGVGSAGMARSRDRRNTPAEVAKKGPPCDIKEVHKEWDNDDNIRNRLREGGTFLEPGTVVDAENIQKAVTNKNTLMPLLCRMSVLDRRPLPAVEDLRDEINETLTANKRVGQGEVKMIMESASTLKKLCSFLKMKCRRKEVSSVTHQQVRGNFPLVQRFMFISSHSAVASNLSSCYRTYPNLPNPNLPEEGDFQLLCLALDPMLQVREKYIGFQCLAS